jgi:GMP synthase (glutamine-hydrolysing)
MHVYCELYSCLVDVTILERHEITAIVLSGGPSSVYEEDAPHVSEGVWKLIEDRNIPVLGICYGMQELAHVFGGQVAPGLKHEYGKAMVRRVEGCNSPLFEGLPSEFQMWMSHGDKLSKVPDGYQPVGELRFTFRMNSDVHFVIPCCNSYFCFLTEIHFLR